MHLDGKTYQHVEVESSVFPVTAGGYGRSMKDARVLCMKCNANTYVYIPVQSEHRRHELYCMMGELCVCLCVSVNHETGDRHPGNKRKSSSSTVNIFKVFNVLVQVSSHVKYRRCISFINDWLPPKHHFKCD